MIGASDVRFTDQPWLIALARYFFVRAPSRAETARQAKGATVQLAAMADRLRAELILLDAALRPNNPPPPRG